MIERNGKQISPIEETIKRTNMRSGRRESYTIGWKKGNTVTQDSRYIFKISNQRCRNLCNKLTGCVKAEVGGPDSDAKIEANHGPSENQGNHSNGGEEKQTAFARAGQSYGGR